MVPNDENAAPIIHYLQSLHIKAKTFPVTGQDATLVGLQNILTGYQCGTVYKPIYLEAQAAVALAIILRAHETPPGSLVNKSVTDTVSHIPGSLGADDAGVGHAHQHERDGHQGPVRAAAATVRRPLCGRVHGSRDQGVTRINNVTGTGLSR